MNNQAIEIFYEDGCTLVLTDQDFKEDGLTMEQRYEFIFFHVLPSKDKAMGVNDYFWICFEKLRVIKLIKQNTSVPWYKRFFNFKII